MPKTSNLLIKVALHSYPRKPKPLPTAEAGLFCVTGGLWAIGEAGAGACKNSLNNALSLSVKNPCFAKSCKI
jgi:hypothetical protein